MTRNEIEEKVREFLIDDLEIDEDKIKGDAMLKDDMGIDSFAWLDGEVGDDASTHVIDVHIGLVTK